MDCCGGPKGICGVNVRGQGGNNLFIFCNLIYRVNLFKRENPTRTCFRESLGLPLDFCFALCYFDLITLCHFDLTS